MTQTSAIAGAIALAYAVFIIVRGELPCYMQVLGVSTAAACPKGAATPATPNQPAPAGAVALSVLPSGLGITTGSSSSGIGGSGIGINVGLPGGGGSIGLG